MWSPGQDSDPKHYSISRVVPLGRWNRCSASTEFWTRTNYGGPLPCLYGAENFQLTKTVLNWDVVSDISYWSEPAFVELRLGLATNEWAVMYGYEGKNHAEQGAWFSGSSENVEYRLSCNGLGCPAGGEWFPMTAREIDFGVNAGANSRLATHLTATIEFRSALTHAYLGQIYIELSATSR